MVFMFFCAMSYVDRQFSFDETQMKKYVGDAVSACGFEIDVATVIRDFRESISIMELVGLNYEFAHRSFQEYFYANFVITDRKLSLEKKVGRLCESFASDDTIEMIADMDKTYFEDEFLLPRTKLLDVKVSRSDPEANPAGVLSKFFSRIQVDGDKHRSEREGRASVYYTISDLGNAFIWRQALLKYRDEIPSKYTESYTASANRREREAAILGGEFSGEVKIHHTNNLKLRRIGADRYATQIKVAISSLRQHLEAKQEKRKRGLGALIRGEYVRGKLVL